MAKKTSGYTITDKAAKEEFRRLTQFANRRIAAAMKAYEKEGRRVAPYEVTGGIQTREQWASKSYALSRSISFATEKEYRQHLHWLRQFEHMRPNMSEYTEAQREKTLLGIETSLGTEVPEVLKEMINKLNAPQLAEFWKKFSEKTRRMGFKYSSGEAIQQATTEFFTEDNRAVVKGLATDIKSRQWIKVKQPKANLKKKAAKKKQ